MGGILSRKYPLDPEKDLLDLTGKVVVVTGSNKGIGYETVKILARHGAKVYMAARNGERAKAAIEKLRQENLGPGNGQVVWLPLDLVDLKLVKKSAEEFLRNETRLDILIHNAAIQLDPYELTGDGLSNFMAINHFGPFVFTRTVLPLLKKTAQEPNSDVRIVTVSSINHFMSRAARPDIKFKGLADFNQEFKKESWPALSRYGVTKLANILFMKKLQKKLDAEGTAITCMSLHPGEIDTGFTAKTPWPRLMGLFMSLYFSSPEKGAYNSCFAAASPLVKENRDKYKGAYLDPVGLVIEPSANAKRDDLAEDLWNTTEKVLADIGI